MNTGHTHNEGDLYADDIHDAEFQDAEIIDEEIHEHAPTAPKPKDKPAMPNRPMRLSLSSRGNSTKKRTNTCVCLLNLKTTNDVLPKKDRTYSNLPDKMS